MKKKVKKMVGKSKKRLASLIIGYPVG